MITSITVTFIRHDSDGDSANGGIAFLATAPLTDASTSITYPPDEQDVHFDTNGQGSVNLLANDDPTTLPAGTGYRVAERIDGSPDQDYIVIVPHNAPGGTVDLDTLGRASATALYAYVPLTLVGEPGGVASLDGAGENAQLPLEHAASHATSGDDPIDPVSIGAATAAALTTEATTRAAGDAANAAAIAAAVVDTDTDVAEEAAIARAAEATLTTNLAAEVARATAAEAEIDVDATEIVATATGRALVFSLVFGG